PGTADEVDGAAAREIRPRGIIVSAVGALVEVAARHPLLQFGGGDEVLIGLPGGAGVAHREIGDLLGVHVLALDGAEHVRGGPSVEVAEHDRGAAVAGDRVQGGGEVLPRRERIDVDAVFRGRVPGVEYAHHFSGLGEAVGVAAAGLGGVCGV